MSNVHDSAGSDRDRPTFCYGCGELLRSASMLVCAECLGQECDEYYQKTKDQDNDSTD